MQPCIHQSGAVVLAFIAPRRPDNRFTMLDRIQALDWHGVHACPIGARLTIHGRQADDAPEVGDYIGIYRANDCWAVWGAARQGPVVTVWHAPTGADLGTFSTMRDALAALDRASIQPRV